MKNVQDVLMFKLIQDILGIKVFCYVFSPHAAIKLPFRNWRPLQSVKFCDFLSSQVSHVVCEFLFRCIV